MKMKQSTLYREFAIPEHPGLMLHIYGVDKARNLEENMAQGYYITRAGIKVARAELDPTDRQAVENFLRDNHPEHVKF